MIERVPAMTSRSLATRLAWTGERVRGGRLRRRPPKIAALALPLILPGALLILWQVAVEEAWLSSQILPSPFVVLVTFADLVRSGDIAVNLAISLRRIATGFAIGASAGLALGIALGVSSRLEQYLGPSLRAFAQVPSLGWLPFLFLIFGIGETLNYVVIAKACFVPIVLNTSAGIRNIPKHYVEVARVLRLRPSSLVFRLILPAALPTVFSGVRLALSHAWIALIVVEMLADTAGVGYMMISGRTLFQIDVVIAGMTLIGIIGFLMDSGLRRIERRLRRWAPAHD
jgi:sulfonate transport system permease protein